MNNVSAHVAKNIKAIAKENGIKISDIEDMAHLSKGYLSKIASRKYENYKLSIDNVFTISNVLKVSVDVLCSPMIDFDEVREAAAFYGYELIRKEEKV